MQGLMLSLLTPSQSVAPELQSGNEMGRFCYSSVFLVRKSS